MARSVLALYCYDDNPDDTSISNVFRQSIDLIGYFPALIAYAYQAKSSFYDNMSLHPVSYTHLDVYKRQVHTPPKDGSAHHLSP